MTKWCISVAVFLGLFTTGARADWLVGNGGDAVKCDGSVDGTFNGYFAYDYLVSFDGNADAYHVTNSIDQYLNDLEGKLTDVDAELAASFSDFKRQVYNTSFANKRIWQAAPFGLIDIAGGQAISLVPADCRDGENIRVVQAVIRQPGSISGLPADKILYRYVPEVTDGLASNNPLQLSFLMVHEWLWDQTTDIRVVQRVTNYLHTKEFYSAHAQMVHDELRGMGLRVSVGVQQTSHRLGKSSTHACYIKDDFKVVCWGKNQAGQSSPPAELVRPTYLTAVGDTTCAADEYGVTCWGLWQTQIMADHVTKVALTSYERNSSYVCYLYDHGKLGCSGFLSDRVPQGITDFVDVAMTPTGYTCALSQSQGLKCFGNEMNHEGDFPAMTNISSIHSTNEYAFCAVADAKVYCWGVFGQSAVNQLLRVEPNDLFSVVRNIDEVFCGFSQSRHRLWCSSNNPNHDLVTGRPQGITSAEQLEVGPMNACVVSGGKIRCWGDYNALVRWVPDDLRL